MNHRAVYDALIARAAGRVLTEYCEGHHIIPRSLGGNNAKSNIVKLTYREHFLAHWLLIKFTKGRTRRRMMHALTRMAQCHSGRIIAGWQYEVAKRAKVVGTKAQWADPEAKIRTPWNPKRRAKMSAASKARWANPKYRAKMSAAVKAQWANPESKIRAQWANPERRAKKSAAAKAQWANPESKIRAQWANPEYSARKSAAAKARCANPEYRAKKSAASKAAWASPEYRAKIGAATKAAWADGAHSKHSTAMKAAWARGVYSKQSTLDDGVGMSAANSGH